ncbi:MAG TPA: sigma-70 family RNA polymerase sigma factor [Gemmatimonadaceae bacterium]|nr:sigma-70 family RNA polymerase sigma factor [Gemmatimonadaceae bacterium]
MAGRTDRAALAGSRPVDRVNDGVADERLVELVRAGDMGAYDKLVRRYLRRAYVVAFRLLEHREDAEDLVQETFMTVLSQLHTYETGRPFAPWMYRILINRGLNARRSRSRRRMEAIPDDAAGPSRETPDVLAERADVRARFQASLASLPPRQRLVVQLIEIDGLSRGEVAKVLDLSEATVRWHVCEARRVLKRVLAPLRMAQ